MNRTTGARRPGGRGPQRSGGAAFERSDPGPAMLPMAEIQKRVKMRSRVAAQKLAAEFAQVSVTIRTSCDKYKLHSR